MGFPAVAIANEFLDLAQCDGEDITPLKMQKLVYFAHGWYLALFGEPLLDEPVEAWEFGPVVKSPYREFKRFGGVRLQKMMIPVSRMSGISHISRINPPSKETENASAVIKRVWEQYKQYSAFQLVSLTHSPDSPWSAVPDRSRRGAAIPDADIKQYFKKRLRKP